MEIKAGQVWRIVGLSEKSVVEVTSITGNVVFFEYDGEETSIKDRLTVSEFLEFHEFVRPKESTPRSDAINHPEHYISHPSGIECIEVTRHMGFAAGNIIKYLWRNGLKDGEPSLKDLKKAAWYLNDMIDQLETNGE